MVAALSWVDTSARQFKKDHMEHSHQNASEEQTLQFLEACEAVRLDLNTITSFDRDALPFFINEELISDPFVDASFRCDITKAKHTFAGHKARLKDATFTGFIFWCAIKALSSVRQANFRIWRGHWYELKNPAFFMPIATGDEFRLASTIMQNVCGLSFEDFTTQYADLIARAKGGEKFSLVNTEIFGLAHNLVNLPNIRFTNIKPHALRHKNTHVWWLFGQRYEEAEKLYVPMTMRMHHANGDPVIFDQIMGAFERYGLR
jgi:chloramphenicol O-acetyltransferase